MRNEYMQEGAMKITKNNIPTFWIVIILLTLLAQSLINRHLMDENKRLERMITVYENGSKDYYCK